MSDILASVSVVLGAEISGFRAAMAQARRELKGLVQFSEGLKDIGTSLTQYVTAPLALFSGAAVAASGKIESLKKGLEAITLQELGKQGVTGLGAMREAAEQTTARLAQLQEIAKLPGLGFEGAVQGDVRLRAVGISAEQSAKSIRAFANAIATTGGGKSEFDRVTVQLAQLSAKGKVLAQDLRPIIEAAPAVSGALQRLYGTVDSETISASLAKQGKSSTDFIAVLTDELAKLPQVTGGLKNGLENFVDTGTLALAKLGDGISKALNLPGILAGLSSFVERAANAFAGLTPGTQTLIVALGGIAAAVGPVLVAVGTLGAALPAITAGFEVLGVSSLAALGPILPAAAAVAAAAYLIYDNWSAIAAYFSSGEGSTLFSDLASAARSAASAIGEAFSTIRANVGGNLGQMVSAATVFRTVFRELAVGVTAALDVLAGSVKAINGLLTGDTVNAAEGTAQAFYGLIDPIANLFGFSKKAPTDSGIYVLTQQAKEFNAVGPQLAANLALLNGVRLDVVATQAGEVAKQIGLLKKLEDELKAAKEAKPNLTTEADIAASNQLIASLEAQIKRLNELGVASKEMQKAYADVQKSLRTVANESLALGDQYDYLKSRQSATESGIKKLIAAGFTPASVAVQRLVADLRNLNTTLGDNEQLSTRVAKGLEKMNVTPEFKLQTPEPLKLPDVVPMDLTGLDLSAEGLAAGYDRLHEIQNQKYPVFTQAMADFNTNVEQLIDQFPSAAFAQIGQSIGDAIVNGTSIIAGFGAGLIKALADVMAQYGKIVLLKGAADIAIGNYGMGALELVAGAALVAGAGVASSFASSIGSSSASSSPISPKATSVGQGSSQQTVKVVATFELRGKDLIAIGRSEDYRQQRTG